MNQHTMRKADHLRLMKAEEVRGNLLKDELEKVRKASSCKQRRIESLKNQVDSLRKMLARRDEWISSQIIDCMVEEYYCQCTNDDCLHEFLGIPGETLCPNCGVEFAEAKEF